MTTRRLTLISLYTAIALTIFVAEAQIPVSLAVPGIKLGLANIVTLVALQFLGRRDAGMILAVRVTLGSLFVANPSVWLFSAAGGLAAYLVMSPATRLLPREQIWVVSVLGALAHNGGQLLMAMLYMGSVYVLAALPPLIISAIITGCFTGLCARWLLRYERWLKP